MAKDTPKTTKKRKILPEILLVVSALILGSLIVLLVYRSHVQVRTAEDASNGENKEYSGSFPKPSELAPEDMDKFFSIMEIPSMVFAKMNGVSYNEESPAAREDLRYVKVLYWGTDNTSHQGELIVHQAIAKDIAEIFYSLYKASYPIGSIELIDEYGGNDEISMAHNNSSGYNCRRVKGTDVWSMHAYGLAIDLNPLYNPYVSEDGTVLPLDGAQYADRTKSFLYRIDQNDYAYQLFIEHGFSWGGDWEGTRDYQHFEKNI